MKISFYESTIHLTFNIREGLHLFPKREQVLWMRISGVWETGLTVMRSSAAEYDARPDHASAYYKAKILQSGENMMLVTTGWSVISRLRRSDYNYPCRGSLDVTLAEENGVPVLKIAPLSTVRRLPNSPPLFASEVAKRPDSEQKPHEVAEPVAKPFRFPPSSAAPIPTMFRKPETDVSPPFDPARQSIEAPSEPPVKLAEKVVPAVKIAESVRPVSSQPVPKSVDALKGLAAELNKSLEAVSNLMVDFRDGVLILEEEVIEFEEF